MIKYQEATVAAVAGEVALAMDEEVNNRIYFKIKYCKQKSSRINLAFL